MKLELKNKEEELRMFETILGNYLKDKKTKRGVIDAWKQYLNNLSEDYRVPVSWYKLTMEEKRELYRYIGLI